MPADATARLWQAPPVTVARNCAVPAGSRAGTATPPGNLRST